MRLTFRPRLSSRILLPAVLAVCCIGLPLDAARAQPCTHTMDSLKKLSPCELQRLFEQSPPGEIPVGFARGQVLVMIDAKFPRLNARLGSSLWKGKHFDADGGFINQWPGFKALSSRADLGTSWLDGKPAIVIEYPPDTPIFGNNRDELRQVAPGLFLCRLYDKCPCPRFRGYFAIEVACPCR